MLSDNADNFTTGSSLVGHVDRLGHALTIAVTAYNQTVGSLEGRVLVSGRGRNQLGVVDAYLKACRQSADRLA